jgi:hypothetical protein
MRSTERFERRGGNVELSAETALDTLLARVRARDPDLASLMQAAVDEGKLVDRTEALKGKKNQTHTYRKVTRLSGEEALEKATSVLQAYFVELPMCIASMQKELGQAAVSSKAPSGSEGAGLPLFSYPNEVPTTENRGQIKDFLLVSIDLANEAKLGRNEGGELLPLKGLSEVDMAAQRQHLTLLRELLVGVK